jgi:hypothetical protein
LLFRYPTNLGKPASSLPLIAYRSEHSTDFQAECVAFFAEVVQVFGVPKSVGQIYGLLYGSPEPLSFSDIVERLEISKGSASQGLQLLRSLGAIKLAEPPKPGSGISDQAKREGSQIRPGVEPSLSISHPHSQSDASRRDYYEPELGLRKLVNGVLRERLMPLATTRMDRLTRLRELAEQDGEGRDFFLDRVRQLEIWRRRLKAVLPVLTVKLGPRSKK